MAKSWNRLGRIMVMNTQESNNAIWIIENTFTTGRQGWSEVVMGTLQMTEQIGVLFSKPYGYMFSSNNNVITKEGPAQEVR